MHNNATFMTEIKKVGAHNVDFGYEIVNLSILENILFPFVNGINIHLLGSINECGV
jgi:hypothetical protein